MSFLAAKVNAMKNQVLLTCLVFEELHKFESHSEQLSADWNESHGRLKLPSYPQDFVMWSNPLTERK